MLLGRPSLNRMGAIIHYVTNKHSASKEELRSVAYVHKLYGSKQGVLKGRISPSEYRQAGGRRCRAYWNDTRTQTVEP